MNLESAIQHLKESLADPTHKWGCEECKAEHEQLLKWLEDYKQIKSDYIELDNRLRTANTEIDRLRSESGWIPCSERLPGKWGDYLVTKKEIGWNCEEYQANDIAYYDREGFHKANTVLAWMPLPEPYRRGEEE